VGPQRLDEAAQLDQGKVETIFGATGNVEGFSRRRLDRVFEETPFIGGAQLQGHPRFVDETIAFEHGHGAAVPEGAQCLLVAAAVALYQVVEHGDGIVGGNCEAGSLGLDRVLLDERHLLAAGLESGQLGVDAQGSFVLQALCGGLAGGGDRPGSARRNQPAEDDGDDEAGVAAIVAGRGCQRLAAEDGIEAAEDGDDASIEVSCTEELVAGGRYSSQLRAQIREAVSGDYCRPSLLESDEHDDAVIGGGAPYAPGVPKADGELLRGQVSGAGDDHDCDLIPMFGDDPSGDLLEVGVVPDDTGGVGDPAVAHNALVDGAVCRLVLLCQSRGRLEHGEEGEQKYEASHRVILPSWVQAAINTMMPSPGAGSKRFAPPVDPCGEALDGIGVDLEAETGAIRQLDGAFLNGPWIAEQVGGKEPAGRCQVGWGGGPGQRRRRQGPGASDAALQHAADPGAGTCRRGDLQHLAAGPKPAEPRRFHRDH